MPLIPDQGEKREGEATEANIWHGEKEGDRKRTEGYQSEKERNEGVKWRGEKRENQMKIERKRGVAVNRRKEGKG